MSDAWPMHLERFNACVEVWTLYEHCGCKSTKLKHNRLHHDDLRKNCHFIQPYHVILREKCGNCKRCSLFPGRRSSRFRKVGMDALAEKREQDMQKRAELKEDARQRRLDRWTAEIAKYELFQKAYRAEQAAIAAFQESLRGHRIQEESNTALHPDDRVVVYDYKEEYCELLSQIYRQELATCCVCGRSGRPELKRFPCGHAIHDGLCLKRWLSSAPSENLECPQKACNRRINVHQMPLCPLTDLYHYRDSSKPDSGELLSACSTESGGEGMASIPPSTALGTRAIMGPR